jgi:hypothetical protein
VPAVEGAKRWMELFRNDLETGASLRALACGGVRTKVVAYSWLYRLIVVGSICVDLDMDPLLVSL